MKWETYDESMIYLPGHDPIVYTILCKRGECTNYCFILHLDRPTDSEQTKMLTDAAEIEFTTISGMWAGEIVNLMDRVA